MEQTEITEELSLLDEKGRITREGYARLPLWNYDRDRIRAPWWRIKEWDYYAVIDQNSGKGVTITLSDLGYVGLFALCFVDVRQGMYRQIDSLKLLTRGKTGLHPQIDEPHSLSFEDGKLRLELIREEGRRILRFSAGAGRADKAVEAAGSAAAAASGSGRIEGEVVLEQPADKERMAVATSWAQKRTAFYYNQKINCMPAEGWVRAEGEEFRFDPKTSFGVLDWGRGHWTYRNRWYWSSASGLAGGLPFGFNLGYGFSDRSPASENMLFYDGRAHKLGEVSFDFDHSDPLKPWKISSGDGRLDLDFHPAVNRFADTNLLLIRSLQHQVFGRFSGTVRLDDGTQLTIKDLIGFAEDVYNRW